RTPLAGRQLRVSDDRVGPERRDNARKLLGLALAEVGAGVGVRPALQKRIEYDRTGRLGERGKLMQRVLGLRLVALPVHADEHHVLEANLSVLDLGDILEFRGKARNAGERLTVGPLELVAIGIGVG